MKFPFLIFFSFFFVYSGLLQANNKVQIDSLKQISTTQKGEEKLKTLNEIAKQTIASPQSIAATSELETEARTQESDAYIASAYYWKLYHGVFETQLPYDSLVYYADEAIKGYQKAKSIDGRARIEGLMLNYLMNKGSYELALHRTEAFLQTVDNENEKAVAYMMLGYIYLDLEQGKEAIDMARHGISVCQRNANDPSFRIINHSLYGILSQGYTLIGDYSSALTAVDTFITKTIVPHDIYLNKQEKMFEANRRKMHILLKLKQYEKAGELLDSIKAYGVHTSSESLSAELEDGYASYYLCTRKYDKALMAFNKAAVYFTKECNVANYMLSLQLKAQILDGLGNYKQASEAKGEFINLSDSINKAVATSRLAQIQTIYQVERLKAEKEQERLKLQRTYIVGITFGVICLLLIAILLIARRNMKREREKNKKLFEQYKHLPLYSQKVSDTINDTTNDTDASAEAIDKKRLYNTIVDYLLSSEDYTDSALSREDLALRVSTNRQYLIEAIQENSAMTYGEFIMSFRLEHARTLLLKNENLTINELYQLSGFTNKSTFYKHFCQKYGMTPAEFKSFVNEDYQKKEVQESDAE